MAVRRPFWNIGAACDFGSLCAEFQSEASSVWPCFSNCFFRAAASWSHVSAMFSSWARCVGLAVRAISRHSAACCKYSLIFRNGAPLSSTGQSIRRKIVLGSQKALRTLPHGIRWQEVA
jgi:hypothetical protein